MLDVTWCQELKLGDVFFHLLSHSTWLMPHLSLNVTEA